MRDTVAAEAAVDEMIPVAGLLELVRRHAEADSWCDEAEQFLGLLGLRFEPSEYCGCAVCQERARELGLAARFTLVKGAPEAVDRAAVAELARRVRAVHPFTTADLLSEAAERFGLKVEAGR